ncbi:hypothetical protein BCU68_16205 [Vibrio sp. 10N.286.49.B3]|uniref:protease modulator HflC n=1 Tax=Vibrio sp. 10N.286.49.B3 TaxID=1880855 RepID=UPI000C8169EC|nr:protease modulator HflC [Vibrio sp. 10N.286.49.B3]PMH40601.1 hypothetical protein BCU68_16205 [Vibrio sp. 10N.286.49.B3]
MKKIYLWAIFSLVIGYGLFTCILPVKETEFVIISQFGKPIRVIDKAGPVLKLPDPIQTSISIDNRLQSLSVKSTEYGTRDRRSIVMEPFIIWRVTDPTKFLLSARSIEVAQQRLTTLANGQISSMLASTNLNQIFSPTEKDNALEEIFTQVEKKVNLTSHQELGIDIISIRPAQLGYPVQNLQAIYDRMTSEWDRLAKQYHAEGMEAAAEIQARTEREVREMQAKAHRDGQRMLGQSEAQAAQYFAEALTEHQDYYKLVRALESYKMLFNDDSRLILPADSDIFRPLLTLPEVATQ